MVFYGRFIMDLSQYKPEWVAISGINIDNKAFQFRSTITPESVAELAKSLAEDGQKVPITLWKRHSGEQVIISGLRRMAAAKTLQWDKVLAVVIPENDLNEADALRLNFIENIERKTLNNLDIMFACKKLRDSGKLFEEISKLIGKSESQVRNYLRVAEAPSDVQESLKAGETTIKAIGQGKTTPGCGSETKNKNMVVKSTNSGFRATIVFNRKHDDLDASIAFANELIKLMKEQAKLAKKEAADKGKKKQKTATEKLLDDVAKLQKQMPQLEAIKAASEQVVQEAFQKNGLAPIQQSGHAEGVPGPVPVAGENQPQGNSGGTPIEGMRPDESGQTMVPGLSDALLANQDQTYKQLRDTIASFRAQGLNDVANELEQQLPIAERVQR